MRKNRCVLSKLHIFNVLVFYLCFSSVDIREKDFSRAEKWSDDGVFHNRAYFDAESSPASLVIDRISVNDAAIYRCRVDFKYAQTRNAKVNLTIIGEY